MDIQRWRESLTLMNGFFERLQTEINHRRARSYQFERSQFPVYENLIAQLQFLSRHELEVVSAFYEYYRTFESDVVSLGNKLRRWDELHDAKKNIDDRELATALYGLERICTLRRLLLKNTEGRTLRSFSREYRIPLDRALRAFRNKVKAELGYDLL